MPQNIVTPSLVATNRAALRLLLLAQRHCISGLEREKREVVTVQQLAARIKAHHATETVAIYMPHAGEPNLLKLSELISNPLCLPVVTAKHQALAFAAWEAGDALEIDAYGIAIPMVRSLVKPHLMLIPCVGYTSTGLRMGYGGGYYDRTLAKLSNEAGVVNTIGVAWSEARCDFQPSEHDIAMDSMHLV